MTDRISDLSDKEKETLRLMVGGHDAKSMARALGLSVHTINDRLRSARRKLSVTSSREAARLLLEHERADPENSAGKELGNASDPVNGDDQPSNGHQSDGRSGRIAVWMIGGLIVMSLIAALILTGAQLAPTADGPATDAPTEAIAAQDAELESAARDWLALVDASDWKASFEAAGRAFQDANTVDGWKQASQQARVPLGNPVSRTAAEFEYLNAPPNGYRMVRFQTDFEHRKGAIESVTLEREGDAFKVVGYMID
ncbi:DUF4019 domain-containing protein [Pontixanthobacter aquaemixtae]|uniref:DUF4019 domain-containing protein n=1 Tax=Pontixanthobacter aquaemixtae TaxID=1958940 RepID=A0A844ZX89_9SPHN|nr:DUF4019 domain-containing protein [Pontixanthobacter aquaemixtae]MXO91566.1 DUF4019 domain-containing protein [Pontixanthobacter aquaemixtae]